MPNAPAEHSSLLTAPPGGVWTVEVGVITGALELRTACAADGALTVQVRYQDADEWYTVRGATAVLRDPADAQALHEVLVGVLDRPKS